jgi:hypothetical protein
MDNFEELDSEEFDNSFQELDIEKIKSKLDTYKSEVLCEMITCNRYFKMNNDLTVICMEELSRRREKGDLFNFEDFIESSLNDLPKIDLSIPSIKDMINKIK